MKLKIFMLSSLICLAAAIGVRAYQVHLRPLQQTHAQGMSVTVCPKYVIDYATVISAPTGCLDSKGNPVAVGQKVLPDSFTDDGKGHITNHFTLCSQEQVQWHTNVNTCP